MNSKVFIFLLSLMFPQLSFSSLPYDESSLTFGETRIIRRHYESVTSTQETIREHLKNLALSQWIVITAGTQKGGKGMWGRTWVSPPGNVFATFAIPIPREQARLIPYAPSLAGVALIDTLESYGLHPKLRWVNNALVGDAKIGGILCSADLGNPFLTLIVGIGINVSLSRETADTIDQPVTSLSLLLDAPPTVDDVLGRLTGTVYNRFHGLSSESISRTFAKYREALCYLDEEIEVFDGKNTHKGVFKGVNEHGHLRLQMISGLKTFLTGEIVPKPK